VGAPDCAGLSRETIDKQTAANRVTASRLAGFVARRDMAMISLLQT
jgi:hypothetical protein